MENVVLVNEKNEVLGLAPKATVHTENTPLHRAFSVFVFNSKKELLLQQRSSSKKTWPLIWSNSCCGHPGENESVENAANRRLKFELNLEVTNLQVIIPDYKYRFSHLGIVENEICPVLVAFCDTQPNPNPDEVENVKWISWQEFIKNIKENKLKLSEWCVEESELLGKNPIFIKFLENIK
jgi:isopentenyl-diphosphate delta-isomerase